MMSMTDRYDPPQVEACLSIASFEVSDLVRELEPTLTPYHRSLLHRLRLAAESVGIARATLAIRQR